MEIVYCLCLCGIHASGPFMRSMYLHKPVCYQLMQSVNILMLWSHIPESVIQSIWPCTMPSITKQRFDSNFLLELRMYSQHLMLLHIVWAPLEFPITIIANSNPLNFYLSSALTYRMYVVKQFQLNYHRYLFIYIVFDVCNVQLGASIEY